MVACGDDGGGNQMPPQTIITMSGMIEVTGGNTASGSFSAIAYTQQPSCAAYALEGASPDDPGGTDFEGTFKIPGPHIGVPLEPSGDIYAAVLGIAASTYGGPGTYVNNETTSQILGQIILNEIPNGPNYFLVDGTATVTINADGSGTLTFEDVPEDTEGIPTSISGSVTWTCTEDDQMP
jgi:hypothetical protein